MLRAIYNFFYRFDRKRDTEDTMHYEYETAPYCGHHFNGHKGYWTNSSYHEGDGGECLDTWFFSIYLPNYDDDSWIRWFLIPRQKLKFYYKRYRTMLLGNILGVNFNKVDNHTVTMKVIGRLLKFPYLPKWLRVKLATHVVKIIMQWT